MQQHQIYVIYPNNKGERVISILAGNGLRGNTDGNGNKATFDGPSSVAISESTGRVYVTDLYTARIRCISTSKPWCDGQPLSSMPTVTTLVHGQDRLGTMEAMICDDINNCLYIASTDAIRRVKLSGSSSHKCNFHSLLLSPSLSLSLSYEAQMAKWSVMD
jgi:hypothetical protein